MSKIKTFKNKLASRVSSYKVKDLSKAIKYIKNKAKQTGFSLPKKWSSNNIDEKSILFQQKRLANYIEKNNPSVNNSNIPNYIKEGYKQLIKADKQFIDSFLVNSSKKYLETEKKIFLEGKSMLYKNDHNQRIITSPIDRIKFESPKELQKYLYQLPKNQRQEELATMINKRRLQTRGYYKKQNELEFKRLFNQIASEEYYKRVKKDYGTRLDKMGLFKNYEDFYNSRRNSFNILDFGRQTNMLQVMQNEEFSRMVESLIKNHGYSFDGAIEEALRTFGGASNSEFSFI